MGIFLFDLLKQQPSHSITTKNTPPSLLTTPADQLPACVAITAIHEKNKFLLRTHEFGAIDGVRVTGSAAGILPIGRLFAQAPHDSVAQQKLAPKRVIGMKEDKNWHLDVLQEYRAVYRDHQIFNAVFMDVVSQKLDI